MICNCSSGPKVHDPGCATEIDDMFGGPDGEAQNALRAALKRAARNAGHEGEYAEYSLLNGTPRTTLVVLVVEALGELGYEIVKRGPEGGGGE